MGNPSSQPKLTGFFKRLAQYYAEFLSTDFKKQQLPKRRLQTSDAKGRLVGIALHKYPGFEQKLWEMLTQPIETGLAFNIARGSWQSTLPKAVSQAIEAQIAQISSDDLDALVSKSMEAAQKIIADQSADPELAFEKFIEEIRASLARRVIGPLLDRLDDFFSRTENKPVETMREFEDQLSSRLTNGVEGASGSAFSTLLVDHNPIPLESLLRDQLKPALVRSELVEFFATFASGDLYTDLSDLVRTSRLLEDVDFYLHIGEVHHSGHAYPIFYIPCTAERTERGFKIDSEPRLYVNKRAMDYVAQEVARAEGRPTVPSVVRDRIFYLNPDQSPVTVAQLLLDEIAAGFNLKAAIDLGQPREQKASSLLVTANNRLSFSLFDRADEAMVNDYEALLSGLEAGGDVLEFFQALINDFLLTNPISVHADVEREWEEMSMPLRLVFDSPLPLAEEQRKILSAIHHPKARFIAVEGPPGTGKSHTITAVAFDTILSGKSLLVLSDKKEALDVVEDRLNQVLAKVRPSDDFLNPILRLGKGASNYAELLRKSTIDRLKVNHRLVKQHRNKRDAALSQERQTLLNGLGEMARAYESVDIAEIAAIQQKESELFERFPEMKAVAQDQYLAPLAEDFGELAAFVRANKILIPLLCQPESRPDRIMLLHRVAAALSGIEFGPADSGEIQSFTLGKLHILHTLIEEIEDAAIPVIGYLFAGKKLRAIARRLRDECGIDCDRPQLEIRYLKNLRTYLQDIQKRLANAGLENEYEAGAALVASGVVDRDVSFVVPPRVQEAVARLDEAIDNSQPLFDPAKGDFYGALCEAQFNPLRSLDQLATLTLRAAIVRNGFEAVPEIDYLGAKTRIESLNTQVLADRIDQQLLDYYETKKNDAATLGKIIREKKKFPVDKFADLQKAFPCIIAGLRDYAEFIPLKREIFDLVVIDEASQVSIAQALPAIIRAKKVLVLGDRHQFGNVKTTNASREINASYMKDLFKAFAEDYPKAGSEVQTRVQMFDIRHSVLDFIEPIPNFDIPLKKHFRSYPEMIGFSSKYFYGNNLQVMKIRGKPLDEVIEFDAIEHDGLLDQRNINDLEARRIVERIEQLLEHNPAPSVGVITPHSEQQARIASLIHDHPRSDEMYTRLRLKVMTFDTCQGEEREIIFYSLVATKEKDRLMYVFPKVLEKDDSDEIDHNLRLQRLNVGLSRGQEKIVFVHSKPIDQYSSALKQALFYYRNEVERAQSLPTPDDLDASSPMERKVLHWLSQVPIIRELGDDCEIIAQFELGKYLRQLDPSYQHPDYKVDFLIRVSDGDRVHQLVIEYDGFEFHFERGVPAGEINSSTWKSYLTSADLEREKVLESFGVWMIRLNKFNLGKDPVATIDTLLRKRLDMLSNGRAPHAIVKTVVEKAAEVEEGLKSGDYKRCLKCDQDLPIALFSAPENKTGYAHYCRDCRRKSPGNPKFRRSRRHW
jgi:hypothetical protein